MCSMVEENVIIIGKKPVRDYVLVAVLLFNEGHDEIVIRARGNNISKAVDVYNALRSRLTGIELAEVKIDSVERDAQRLVPMIEIRVRRSI